MKILRGPSNEDLLRALEGFPDLAHDDQEVDACSGVLETLPPRVGHLRAQVQCSVRCEIVFTPCQQGMTVVAAERSGRRWLPD